MSRAWWKAAGAAAAVAVAPFASGAGFQLYTEGSAEALGVGGAVSARQDMVSNAWYNPASTAGMGQQAMIGACSVRLQIEYSDDTGDYDLEKRWRTVPHAYYIHPISERMTGTLSINVPYGLATEWQSSWPGRDLAIDTHIEALYFTPALAYKATDRLSLAAGFNLVRADALLRNAPAAFTEMELVGEDLGLGYVLAANYRVSEDWSVAAKFQSRVNLTFEGETHFTTQIPGVFVNADAEADLRLPSSITLGVANTSLEKWTFGFDVLWTEWSTYDELAIAFDAAPGTGAPGVRSSAKNWKDVFSYRFGAEYQLNENWVLRGGYVYDQSPVKEETRAPEMPGSDRHMFMVGVGYEQAQWGVDAAYSYLMADKADAGVLGARLRPEGEYSTTTHLVAVSVKYRF